MAERRNRHGGRITCREAVPMIRDYISGEIRDRDLRNLIAHVRICPACYNELETDFMVDRTVNYLNSEEDRSFDLKPLLERDLQEREVDVRRRGWMSGLHSWIVLATVILIILLLLDLTGIFRLGELI